MAVACILISADCKRGGETHCASKNGGRARGSRRESRGGPAGGPCRPTRPPFQILRLEFRPETENSPCQMSVSPTVPGHRGAQSCYVGHRYKNGTPLFNQSQVSGVLMRRPKHRLATVSPEPRVLHPTGPTPEPQHSKPIAAFEPPPASTRAD